MKSFISSKDIKVLVLDFDGTVYHNEEFSKWDKEYRLFLYQAKYFELTGQDPRNKSFDELKKEVKALLPNASLEMNLLTDQYRWDLDYNKSVVISNKDLKKLSESYRLYIVSNNTISTIESYSKDLKLDLKHIKQVLVNNYTGDASKLKYYEQIVEAEKIKPSQMLVIGDNYKKDISPILEIGGNGMLIENKYDILDITSKDIKRICNQELLEK